ncbi:MAG: DUF2505 family protein [Deltaproteobacteria bacterium]|nr:DUF2505 family protein [Deltaproteobacteria bacterium]MBW2387753.1 DUF2505 family protein [Deltaproteobacteria bacterium]
MRLHCEHDIPLDAEFFWAHIHASVYEEMSAEAIGLLEYTEVERSENDESIYRKIRVVPGMPDGLHSLLRTMGGGQRVSYFEEQWRSKVVREVRWKITPGVMADRIRVEGVVRVEPMGDASCRRILDGAVRVRLPGVGTLIERTIVENTVAAYAAHALVAARL